MNSILGGANRAAALLLVLALAACDSVSPSAALVAATPSTDPTRPATPFTNALGCVGVMLMQRAPTRTTDSIGVGFIPDSTGRIGPGLRGMVTTSIANIAGTSGRLEVLEILDPALMTGATSMVRPGDTGGMFIGPAVDPRRPVVAFQFVGELSQADRNVQQSGTQAGLAVGDASLGGGSTDALSAAVLELRMVDANRRIVASTSNMVAVRNRGFGMNAGFRLGSFGATLDLSVDRNEGPHQAVRTLVELSVVELIGQKYGLPYWRCLAVDRNHPTVMAQIRRWYDAMGPAELEEDVRRRLAAIGWRMPPAPASAAMAIADYQQANGLVANGRPTFETYAALLSAQLGDGASSAAAARPTEGVAGALAPPIPRPAPLAGGTPRLQAEVREQRGTRMLSLLAEVDRAAALSCFYQDEEGRIVRVLPNPTRTDETARGGEALAAPPLSRGGPPAFVIQPRRMTPSVGFLCVAAPEEAVSLLPAGVRTTGFRVVRAATFAEIVAAFQAASGGRAVAVELRPADPEGRWQQI